jgi:tRNA 2-selenouridine synthase
MRRSQLYFLEVPFEERLDYITREYGAFKKEELADAITRIQKRLGGQNTKNALGHLAEDDVKECFRILLHYYDKFYQKDLDGRDSTVESVTKVSCEAVDAELNYLKLIG